MVSLVVQSEKVIARPIDTVRAQFVDLEHHAKTGVHSTLHVSNVRKTDKGCLFTGKRKLLGKLQQDEVEVVSHPDGTSTLRSIEGPNKGLLITQAFDAVDGERTRVRTSVEVPLHGVLRLLAPLVRLGVKRDLELALEEDRRDLEEHGYSAHGVTRS